MVPCPNSNQYIWKPNQTTRSKLPKKLTSKTSVTSRCTSCTCDAQCQRCFPPQMVPDCGISWTHLYHMYFDALLPARWCMQVCKASVQSWGCSAKCFCYMNVNQIWAKGVNVDKLIIVQKRITVFTVHSLPLGKHLGNFVLYQGELYRLAASVFSTHLLGGEGSLTWKFFINCMKNWLLETWSYLLANRKKEI